MPNYDPQNVYILQDFPTGPAVEEALKKAEVSVSESQVDTKLETKQDTLDTAQMAAVNSGITAEKVTEIVNTVTEVQTIVIEKIPEGQSLDYATNIDVTIDNTNYQVTFQLKDQNNQNLGTAQTIDLPIESLVMNVEYDSVHDAIVITLQNGTTTSIPVSSLTSGLQPAITNANKLSADLVDDSATTNKFINATQAAKIADSVNKVKMQDLENVSGLVIENGTGSDKVITHSNNVTPVTTAAFNKVLYDAHGHVTGSSAVVAADVTDLVSADNLVMSGYEKPSVSGAINTNDTINEAIGKLEKGLESAGAITSISAELNSGLNVDPMTGAVVIDVANGHFIPTNDQWSTKVDTSTTINNKALSDNVTLGGSDIVLTGYEIASTESAVDANDTINEAIGKLEKALETAGTKVYTNTTAGWDAQAELVSVKDAIYVYSDYDNTIPAIKVGDGITKVKTLNFATANGVTSSKIAEWDSKVSARLNGEILELY